MSQVDILLPQPTLSPCELRKSPDCDSYVDRNGMPPSGSVENHDDKQEEVKPAAATEEPKQNGERDVPTRNRRKRHRRGKKRRWRPYEKLNWEERVDLQDREARRAEKIRADMCACGMTLAPYNTTQFLMDDMNVQEPDYEHIPAGQHRHRPNSNSNGSSDEYYSSPEDEEDFLQQQFTETYKSFHAEHLNSMSKGELVQELMSVEDRLEALQTRLNAVENEAKSRTEHAAVSENHEEQMEKIRVFEEEIRKLTQENERLRKENDDLRRRMHF